jgi:hypothetical protein
MGWLWFCLPSRVVMKIPNVFVIFGTRLGGYSQLGKVLMLALVLVLTGILGEFYFAQAKAKDRYRHLAVGTCVEKFVSI